MGIRVALTLAVTAALALASAGGASAVVGGSAASVPHQAALYLNDLPHCGAVIRDSTHVITAAHCVVDEPAAGPPAFPRIRAPGQLKVVHGLTDLSGSVQGGIHQVVGVSVHRRYDRNYVPGSPCCSSHDIAVLALATPTGASGIPLASATDFLPGPGGTVSGWGFRSSSISLGALQAGPVDIRADADCASLPRFVGPAMVCTGGPSAAACAGDDGGPLTVDRGTGPRLAGIIAFGNPSCLPAGPVAHTQLNEPSISEFLATLPPAPPAGPSDTRIFGATRAGSTVNCRVSGALPAGASVTQVIWYSQTSSGGYAVIPGESRSTYTVPASLVGRRLRCDVRIENGGGFHYTRSTDAFGPVQPARSPDADGGSGIVGGSDTIRPVSQVRFVRCPRPRRRGVRRTCTIRIVAVDLGSIIRRVEGRLLYRIRTCRRRPSGRRACRTRRGSKRVRVTGSGAIFKVVLRRATPGRYTIRLRAVDGAGNRQSRAATKSFTVGPPRR
jgi:hypothetical protein